MDQVLQWVRVQSAVGSAEHELREVAPAVRSKEGGRTGHGADGSSPQSQLSLSAGDVARRCGWCGVRAAVFCAVMESRSEPLLAGWHLKRLCSPAPKPKQSPRQAHELEGQ